MPMNPRLLVPRAAGGFDPRKIAGLWAWWDAADDSTVTIDTGVSVWLDKSTAARQATQTVGTNQPTRTQTINGRKVLSFDGTNHSMTFSGAARTVETLFVVGRQRDAAADAANTSRTGTLLGASSELRGMRVTSRYGSNDFQTDYIFAGFTGGTNRITRTYVVSGGNGDAPLAVYGIVRNGASGMQGFFNRQDAGTATGSESLAIDRIGRNATSTNLLIGEIAEIIIYDRALSNAERGQVTDYLVKRWAIPTPTYTIT